MATTFQLDDELADRFRTAIKTKYPISHHGRMKEEIKIMVEDHIQKMLHDHVKMMLQEAKL